jgi:hypothetical protein
MRFKSLTAPAVLAALALLTAPAWATDWARTNSAAYGFSADFPSKPKEETSVQQGVKMYSLAAGDRNGLCLVLRGEYPYVIDPDVELVASRDSFVKGMSAKLTTSKRITFQRGDKKLQAMEFDAASATHDMRSILVIDGSYAYQVAAAVPKTGGEPKDLERCVRGLTLTP